MVCRYDRFDKSDSSDNTAYQELLADLRAIPLAAAAANQRAELARRDIWQLAGVLPDINSRGTKRV